VAVESGVGLQLATPDIPIGSREHIRRLVNEMDSLPANDDRPNLLLDDDLKDQGSVVRGAMKCCGTKQRKASRKDLRS